MIPSRRKTDDLPANTHPIGWGVIAVFTVLILTGLLTPILVAVSHSSDTTARGSANTAAEANQRNSHCTTAQGLRWRKASTAFQIAVADAANATTDTAKNAALKAVAKSRLELAAVQVDDNRLKDGATRPLCPYVPGDPDHTPNAPVDPTPPSTTPR